MAFSPRVPTIGEILRSELRRPDLKPVADEDLRMNCTGRCQRGIRVVEMTQLTGPGFRRYSCPNDGSTRLEVREDGEGGYDYEIVGDLIVGPMRPTDEQRP